MRRSSKFERSLGVRIAHLAWPQIAFGTEMLSDLRRGVAKIAIGGPATVHRQNRPGNA